MSSVESSQQERNNNNNNKMDPILGYDSDEAPPALTQPNDTVLWRQDPEDSFSDWTIQIVYDPQEQLLGVQEQPSPTTEPFDATNATETTNNRNNRNNKPTTTKIDTYHVHKALLASGPRRSEYFTRLLKDGGRFAESTNQLSRITVHPLAAPAVPILLDYLYGSSSSSSNDHDDNNNNNNTVQISTDTATALHWLSGYFEMRRLRWTCKQFWQTDMDSNTCALYYEHALLLGDEKIKLAAGALCAKHVLQLQPSSRLLHVCDEGFWIALLQQDDKVVSTKLSLHVSKLLVTYIENCGISVQGFATLTSPDCLPNIHRDAAIALMDAECRIVQNLDNMSLTSLQKRCIEAIANDWANFDGISPSDVELLQQQSPFLLTRTLIAFAEAAKNVTKEQVDLAQRHMETQINEERVRAQEQINNEKCKAERHIALEKRRAEQLILNERQKANVQIRKARDAWMKDMERLRQKMQHQVNEEHKKFVRVNVSSRYALAHQFGDNYDEKVVVKHPQDFSRAGNVFDGDTATYAIYKYLG